MRKRLTTSANTLVASSRMHVSTYRVDKPLIITSIKQYSISLIWLSCQTICGLPKKCKI